MADKQIAWLGLGNMGRGMVKNLVEKGNLKRPLIIQNRTRARSEKLAQQLGGKDRVEVVDTPAEAVAKSDIIFSCLGDDAAIKEAYDAAINPSNGTDVKGKLFVDCSTVLPETTQSLADLVTSKGARFVASPVFGAPAMADSGMLVFVLAGPQQDKDQVIPFVKGVMGRAHIDLGEDYGKASILKIVGNSLVMSMVEGLAEAHTLSEKSGVGVQHFHTFVDTMFGGAFAAYSNRMISGDYHKREEPLFAVDLARKDARHMLALGKTYGAKMGNVENIDRHFAEVQKQMGSKGDMAGVYGAARVEAGLPFKN